VGALIAVILLFAPSVILLGMVSPYVIRLRVASVGAAGRASGTVYAISTAGSILGAFLPAFWWIPSHGTRATIYGLGAVMLLVSVAGLVAGRFRGAAPVALFCALPLLGLLLSSGPVRPANGGTLLYDTDSEYGYIQVSQNGDQRYLVLNEGLAVHSIYNPTRLLTGGPWDYFTLAPLYGNRHWDGQKPGRVLIVGLAGGTVARQLTAAFGPVPIDGVEIDPRIIDVGRRYFDMNEPNLNAIAADGRYYLDTTDRQYDLIAIDAYRQPYIPFQLTTKEFFQSCRQHLTPGGVVIVNAGRAPGDYRLVDAVSGTLGAVFPEIYQEDVAASSNTMVFASNQPIQSSEVSANYQNARSSGSGFFADSVRQASAGPAPQHVDPHLPIYSDDQAPVERLVDSIVYGYLTGQPFR
jgi:spermidine synthase